jgi:ATP-dependent Clp protease, protease subunit
MTPNNPEKNKGLPTLQPHVRLLGAIDEQLLQTLLDRCATLEGDGPIVIELSTMGGEAETARRIAQEIRMLAEQREVYLLGKTYVYSAGITILAAVPPARRYLSRDTVLLVHERRFERTVQFEGALRSAMALAEDLLAELKIAQDLERRGFERFVEGSELQADALIERVLERDWYMTADEALSLKLVAGLVG